MYFSACILFVVEENTLNICDQKAVEHAIVECNSSIEILRYSFKDLRNLSKLNGKVLFVYVLNTLYIFISVFNNIYDKSYFLFSIMHVFTLKKL